MAKESKIISIRFYTDEYEKALTEIYNNKSAGATEAVKAYVHIRKSMLAEMKGRFTRAQLSYLIDIQNGTIFEPMLTARKSTWIAEIEDANLLDHAGKKWGIDVNHLIEKVNELNAAEVYFWRELIHLFWHGAQDFHIKSQDLNRFLDEWAAKINICDAILYMQQLYPEKHLTDERVEKYVKIICKVDEVTDNFELSDDQLEELKFALDIEKYD